MGADGAEAKRHGHELFAPIEDAFLTRDGVTVGPMFGSDGLRIRGKVFAFIGWEGGLIAKLPVRRVAELNAAGVAGDARTGDARVAHRAAVPGGCVARHRRRGVRVRGRAHAVTGRTG